ncbi:4Fe-4S ferredoxin [Marinitoga sp. 1137]|uniref:4Fe-4S binding protein n=1 Tax=Marinitoga sp. 1137 TaxID=1545835 RepID=UPI0009507E9C|nr:4Fe-4S binding protein [Marinitoga sp. 1137]APT75626.1 4Fe-4S ferredoxin [Marinitoga sp. 1137]
MKKKLSLTIILMYISQIAFFILFFMLLKNHKLVKWMFVFVAGLLISPFFGRFYCGWVCPINTVFKPIDFIFKKLKIKRFKAPAFLKSKIIRYFMLALFIGAFAVTKMLKIKVNILLYIIGTATLITLFFEEELWHKHLCPYGTMLSFLSQKSFTKLKIDEEKCIGCGLCQQVCPTNTIITLDSKKRKIEARECLMCFQCQSVCPVNAISLKSFKQ